MELGQDAAVVTLRIVRVSQEYPKEKNVYSVPFRNAAVGLESAHGRTIAQFFFGSRPREWGYRPRKQLDGLYLPAGQVRLVSSGIS